MTPARARTGPFDPESGALTIRPPRLPYFQWKNITFKPFFVVDSYAIFPLQAYELLVETLFDSSEKVAKTSMDVFLSSFAMWAQDLDKIESHLFISLISNLENTIKVI